MTPLLWPEVVRRLTDKASVALEGGPTTRYAAVAGLLLPTRPDDFELLLIERAARERDPWSGHLAFPGGRRDDADAGLLQTALRETWEEIGLDLERDAELLCTLDDIQAYARGSVVPLIIRPFLFQLKARPSLRTNEEVASTLWVSMSFLASKQGASTLHWQRGDEVLELPCIRIEGQVLWGLTYAMVAEMLVRLGVPL